MMLKYILFFLISAIITGILGFGVMDGALAVIAKVVFVVSLILLLASMLYDPDRRRSEI